MSSCSAAKNNGSDAILECWEVPSIVHFVWLFQGPLRMPPTTPSVIEHALQNPQTSTPFRVLLSRLVTVDSDARSKLPSGEGYSYGVIQEMLNANLDALYLEEALREHLDDDHPELIRPSIDLASENPLKQLPFHELDLPTRASICNLLCNNLLSKDEDFLDHLRDVQPEDCRIEPFGVDAKGCRYLYFGNDDCRVYRQVPPKQGPAAEENEEGDGRPSADGSSSSSLERFELISSSSSSLRKFMKTLNRKNKSERELYEQMEMLLPDLVETEATHASNAAKKNRAHKRAQEMPVPVKRSRRLHQIEMTRIMDVQKAKEDAERMQREQAERRTMSVDALAGDVLDDLRRWKQQLDQTYARLQDGSDEDDDEDKDEDEGDGDLSNISEEADDADNGDTADDAASLEDESESLNARP